MMRMKHILTNACLLALGAGLVLACSKTAEEGTNVAIKRQFDAWRAIYYPDAVEKDGIYIIDDQAGTGLEWRQSLPVTLLTYTMQNLDGSVQYNTREDWAKRLGTWDEISYYGPQYTMTGENISYAGLDRLLEGMRQGGTRTAIVPSWLMTYNRYETLEEYLEHETEVSATIYTITLLDQTLNLSEYEYNRMLFGEPGRDGHPLERRRVLQVPYGIRGRAGGDARGHDHLHQLHRPPHL